MQWTKPTRIALLGAIVLLALASLATAAAVAVSDSRPVIVDLGAPATAEQVAQHARLPLFDVLARDKIAAMARRLAAVELVHLRGRLGFPPLDHHLGQRHGAGIHPHGQLGRLVRLQGQVVDDRGAVGVAEFEDVRARLEAVQPKRAVLVGNGPPPRTADQHLDAH